MTAPAAAFGPVADLGRALGFLRADGRPNTAWFQDPVGGTATNPTGLSTVLTDGQREALLAFVDDALGPPPRGPRSGSGEAVWVPLVRETDPDVTVHVVVEAVGDEVRLGLGIEHSTGGAAPRVTTRVHVPAFRVPRSATGTFTGGAGLPGWLLLGRAGGRISVSVDATLRDGAAPAGQASLGGVAVTLGVPTSSDDDLRTTLVLRDLQLPGATAPRTLTLDAARLDDLGAEVVELLTGLVRAQADALDLDDPQLRPFAALTGLLGLREVADLPPLPLADLPQRGVAAVVAWVEQLLLDDRSRDAWLGQLAALVGGTAAPERDAVTVSAGPLEVAVGLRVTPGAGGRPVLVPHVQVALRTRPGAQVVLEADLLRADTATGTVRALPSLRAEAVLGRDAGGGALLEGDPGVGSLHVGLAVHDAGAPVLVLTLHEARVGGRSHRVLDLSSPEAALDAAAATVRTALVDALTGLGPAGALLTQLLGLAPPAGVDPVDAAGLLADPLGALAAYWHRLVTAGSGAAEVLGALRALVLGGAATAVPGQGTADQPWLLALGDAVVLRVHRAGDGLVVDLQATTPAAGAGPLAARVEASLALLRVDLVARRVAFAAEAALELRLIPAEGATAVLELDRLALLVDAVTVRVGWSAHGGLTCGLAAPGLRAELLTTTVALPLPTLAPDGSIAFDPDWDGLEQVLAALLSGLQAGVVDVLLGVVGWTGDGPRLSLRALVDDPEAALRAWLADVVLDCGTVAAVLGPVAVLLSAAARPGPLGAGTAASPFRCPVGGHPRAPGLAVWLDPPCPPPAALGHENAALLEDALPEPDAVVAALEAAALHLPDVADLLVGRRRLAEGLAEVLDRWTGTDGLVGAPGSLPAGVTAVEVPGHGYEELLALGRSTGLLAPVTGVAPGAVLQVGCEAEWAAAAGAFDLSADAPAGELPELGGGSWQARLPTPSAAAAGTGGDGVALQAARLAALLTRRRDPVTVVGYGAAGAAVLRAAADLPVVDRVVTVGTPWVDVALTSLAVGLGGDALRLLDRLRRRGGDPWPDPLLALQATPLQRGRLLVERCAAAAAGAVPPSAGAQPVRPDLPVTAVFGSLDAADVRRCLAAVVTDGLAARRSAADEAAATAPDTDPAHDLHVAVDLPVVDLDLDGLLVGAGVAVEVAALGRDAEGGLTVAALRGASVRVHLGVHDGWLVGGPGAARPDVEVRWLSARVDVPLDGRPGDAELVLHEARGFDVVRERWVVRGGLPGADAGVDVTAAVPEVRLVLAEVVARLRVASPDLAALLEALGLSRAGGLDPDAVDRLLLDPAATVRTVLAARPAEVAAALRVAGGGSGAGTSVGWAAGPATVSVDLATGRVTASAALTEPPLALSVTTGPDGTSAHLELGALDPVTGGVRLVGEIGPVTGLRVESQLPGGASSTVGLLPTGDSRAVLELVTQVVPAVLAQQLAEHLRRAVGPDGRAAVEAVLDLLDLLGPVDPDDATRPVRLPLALLRDPAGWLTGAAGWRTDPLGRALRLLDALGPLVEAPGPGTWPLADELVVRWSTVGGRLHLAAELALDAELGAAAVTTRVRAGLSLGADGSALPLVAAAVTVDGRGLRLAVSPDVRLDLLRPGTAPLALHPAGPGLGAVVAEVGGTVLPLALDALARQRTDAPAGSVLRDVGQAVHDLGTALDLLRAGGFDADRISAFAAAPGPALLARLPVLASAGLAALARALDPAGSVVRTTAPQPGSTRFAFGAAGAVQLTLDPSPAVVLTADLELDGVGRLVVERLALSSAGVDVAARLGPVELDLGSVVLRPLVVVRAGTASSERLLALGLALDSAAASSVEFRWTLDARPPSVGVVTRGASVPATGGVVDHDPVAVALRLLALATSLATSVLVEELGPVVGARTVAALQGVVFTDVVGSRDLDLSLVDALRDAEAALDRLERLGWNLATASPPFAVTVDGALTVGLVSEDAGGGRTRLGVRLTLPAGERLELSAGDPAVALEVDAAWLDPSRPGGLAVFLLEGTVDALELAPTVLVAGLGLRFSGTSGPLVELGAVTLDAIAFHVYGEAGPAGVGGGVHLQLEALAFAPGGGGGSNAVANSILTDAGAAGTADRPAFSPALAVQRQPGRPLGVTLRAGDPPGPWWVVVQRQLGPLYLERVGFDALESGGRVARVTLLFDGRLSIFGLTASVDRLSLTWLGGDLFDVRSYAVDLQGLAISADLAGASLAGGLLKTELDGSVSYVGMLQGRFGVYGLSVFGGYTDDHGSPSFFVFGALNGPIGGPPAFFLTGIGGGLGINRLLRVPDDLSRFGEYPFIAALDPAARPPADPLAHLRTLNDYFPPQRGAFWFAAGISFTSFALVDGIAVVAVAFGDGLEISLLGLARLALPRPGAALVSLEIGLVARFSTEEGVFSIRAQLTDNSWLLYPEVRLTGGFAFAVWWKGPLAGQFVLTLGGYHPSFSREGYPDVPRLGLSWRVHPAIVVKGGAYFALTSEALMAGVDVEVSADFGFAWARIAFGAHGIVYFDPFWFEVTAYARISAGVKVDLGWFGEVSFSISISASITVSGPDFSGVARLEVGPCEIEVGFGSRRRVEAAELDWTAFVGKYLEDAGGGRARALSSVTGAGTLPPATGGALSAPTPDGSLLRPFEVFAEFEVTVVSSVPTSAVDADGVVAVPVRRSDGATVSLGLSPMRAGALQSTVRLTLSLLEPRTRQWQDRPAQLRELAAGLRGETGGRAAIGTAAYPLGAWGEPALPGLPAPALPRGDVVVAGSTVRLVAAAETLVVGPEIDYYRVEAGRLPLPLQAHAPARTRLLRAAADVGAPALSGAAAALAQATTELFGAHTAPLPAGVQATGLRSQVSRAAFGRDRAAPPVFGSLADGLAVANGDDVERERVERPEPAAPPAPREPFVLAHLASGAGAARRAPATTVEDRRVKRRPAPSLGSVRGRLGTTLPVQLTLTAPPATVVRGAAGPTLVPTGAVPRTELVGGTRSTVGGVVAGPALSGLVTGLAGGSGAPRRSGRAREEAAPTALRGGDVVLLQLPDAATDTDGHSAARPRLAVAGTARVVLLRGDGTALADHEVSDGEVPVPAGTALVAVHAGGDVDVADGLAGWHARSRVARTGSALAVGPGCVLTADAASTAGTVGWDDAGAFTRDASAVLTRFARPVRTVVVVLEGAPPERTAPLSLDLVGASLATGADGAERAPDVVLLGGTTVLVHAVEPHDDADAVGVRVRAGGEWTVTGVLGGDVDVPVLVRLLAERGVEGVAGRVLAVPAGGCSLTWRRGRTPRTGGVGRGRR